MIPAILIAGLLLGHRSWAEDSKSVAFDYADQASRLVKCRKIDELAKLNIPATDAITSKLCTWKNDYVAEMQKQEADRDKQYDEEVTKAKDLLKDKKYEDAVARVARAYQITRDQNAFLELDWVKDLTAKVAAKAAELEGKGEWLESMDLYSYLAAIYEVDMRYKPDMQRLARRIRLLAVYAPKALYLMRQELNARQKPDTEDATTSPATQDEPTTFPSWQDQVERVAPGMLHDAIERSCSNWVELTSYDTLVKGGVEALRLFLTTPELAREFPGLADKNAVATFDKALNNALAKSAANKNLAIDDVDKIVDDLLQVSKNTIKLPEQVLVMEFTDGAMEKLDPFTAVIWPHEKGEFEKSTRGSFGGVGIQISQERGQLTVISPLEDTPAYSAGILAGDIIAAIDGKTTVNMSIDQAIHTITGTPGTKVVLTIKRAGTADKDYPLTRAVIKVASVKGFQRSPQDNTKWDFMIDPENKIGYIRVTGFQDDTAQELKDALTKLQQQGMRGLVIDLRFNPGGLLNSAIDLSDMFLNDGVIVSTKGRSAPPQRVKAHPPTEIPMTMPMVVLINQYSASASEIFAGAMKDLHRALIVGHRSFGKGSVQVLLKIDNDEHPNDAMMKLTTAYYYLPNGESLHRRDGAKTWGVDPDIKVDITPKQLSDLLKTRRDSEIIHRADEPPATQPTTKEAPAADTQLDTALLMLRLQLVQSTN